MKQRLHPFPSALPLLTSVWLLASGFAAVGCGNDSGNTGPTTNTEVTSASTSSATPATTSSSAPTVSNTSGSPSSSGTTGTTTTASNSETSATPSPTSSTTTTASSESELATSEGVATSSDVDDTSSAPQVSAEPSSSAPPTEVEDLVTYAAGFHELYLHDECTDDNPADDVCAHERVHEVTFAFGGDPTKTYDVKLRIRGLFEPTTISGGETPDAAHPYFKVNGTVEKGDYSQWQIVVGEPANTYYLNHYPTVGHTIYKEDFEATISVKGAAEVKVRVEDANDRQIDNGYVGNPDRQQLIDGVTDEVVDGQVLRLDVLDVTAAQ